MNGVAFFWHEGRTDYILRLDTGLSYTQKKRLNFEGGTSYTLKNVRDICTHGQTDILTDMDLYIVRAKETK